MSEQAQSHDDDVSALRQELAELEAELAIIGSVQQALASRFEVQAIYDLIGDEVRDIFDVFSMVDGKIGLVIADVCDKGLGAALFMILFRSLIRAVSNVEFFTRAEPAGRTPPPFG